MKKKFPPLAGFVFPIFTFSAFQLSSFIKRGIFKTALRLFFFGILAQQSINAFAQDSSHIRISLLTCSPGKELYSTWGHTAIRITDSSSVTDYVFNFGTFNFEDPGFYTKFIRGKLLYYLSVENFQEFKDAYQAENRGITEQLLHLDGTEKIAMMEALYENSKEEHKFYQYDFFFDNCTTRPRDILVKNKKKHPGFKPVMPETTLFRQAIHQYLDKNGKYWSKLGIDLLLGSPTDAVMTTTQSQFLPDNLMKSLEGNNQDHQWVISTTDLYPINQQKIKGNLFTPMIVFSLLLFIIVLLSFSTNKWAKIFIQGSDGIFFFLTGVAGVLIIFMWIGTDHSMTKNNYNLLWALPTNLIAAFYVNSRKKWAGKYFGFTAVALLIVLLCWFFLPQQMNVAFIPLVLILIFRSTFKYLNSLS